jgi:hypothetical protein
LGDLPAPDVPLTAVTTTSGATSRRPPPAAGEAGHGRVAAGDGDPLGPAQRVARAGQLGQPYGQDPACSPPYQRCQAAASVSRWSAPAVDDQHVRSQLRGDLGGLPVRQGEEDDIVAGERVGVVSSRTRSASGSRCGCSAPSRAPALPPAVNVPISTSGWASRSRNSSPPAYPLAPATAIRTM